MSTTETENFGTDALNRRVAQTVASGVKPIELLLEPIYDLGDGEITAYRANCRIHSLHVGTLMPAELFGAAVPESLLFDLSVRLLRKVVRAAQALAERGERVRLLTLRVPTILIYREENLTAELLSVCVGMPDEIPLCLEFYEDVMDADSKTLERAIAEIHAAGLRVAVDGYGGEDFPMEKLLSVCPDILFTSPRVAALASDRGRAAALAPLLNFAKSLGAELIADGVGNDDVLREFRSRDAIGFAIAKGYEGKMIQNSEL